MEDFDKEENFPEKVVYLGKTFKKFEQDYQIVKCIEFGQPLNCEGECLWVDYICEQDESICIDMAYVYREKKRADIFAKLINIEEVKIIDK